MYSPQPVPSAPTPQLARWQVLTITFGAAFWLPLAPAGIGMFLLIFALAVALIADWRGATTLCDLIDWSRVRRARWLVVTLFVAFYMFAFYIYAWRVFRQSGDAARFSAWAQQSAKNKVVAILAVTILVIATVVACASIGSQQNTTNAIAHKTTANLNQNSATHVATPSTKATPAHKNTVATNTPKPTNTPVPAMATPRPPTPRPAPPRPTATPAPRYPAVGGNPWDYTLADTGHLIYSPPANICTYIDCIPSFWDHTNGYVDECSDGTYSHSGGVQGACSHHGGEQQPLYQP